MSVQAQLRYPSHELLHVTASESQVGRATERFVATWTMHPAQRSSDEGVKLRLFQRPEPRKLGIAL